MQGLPKMQTMKSVIATKEPQKLTATQLLDDNGMIPWYIIDPTGERIVKQREILRQQRKEQSQRNMTEEERLALENAPKTCTMRLKRSISNVALFPFWDLVTSLALIFTAIFTPFEVGFLKASASHEPLFIVNRVVDVIFILDMIISFFLMQKVDTRKRTDRQWETRLHVLAMRYLAGWFALDVVSIAPSILDIIAAANADNSIIPKNARGAMRTGKPIAPRSDHHPQQSPASPRSC